MGYGLNLFARKKDGIEFPVEISLGHYKLDDEDFAVAFITDITKRREAEKALLESKNKLDDEAQALQYLNEAANSLWRIENLHDGLGKILETSIRLTGADKGNVQLIDQGKQVLKIAAYKGFTQEFLDYFKEVSSYASSACGRAMNERKQIVVSDTEKEWLGSDAAIARKSGFRAVISTPLLAHDGSPIGIVSVHFRNPCIPDETMLRRMELYARNAQSFIEQIKTYETIKRQNLELEDKVNERTKELISLLERETELNDLKSRFVSMASHEFRTPLSTILSSTALIESYSHDEHIEKRMKHTGRIKSSVKNMIDILNDFLSLDKMEQGKVDVVNEVFDLHEFTEDIIEEMNGILKTDQRIVLSFTGKREIAQDGKILKNIFLNLLSNAIKYSEAGKIIHFSIIVGEQIVIEIRDEGMGIPEEDQPNLFTNFFRAKNAVSIQGTGLGLSIVKKYIELIGGTISFKSKEMEGTTFTVVFPQLSENPAE